MSTYSPVLPMSMPAVAPAREKTIARRDYFAPDAPLTWVYGRLVYADSRTAPLPSRLLARFKHFLWCDVLRQPRLSEISKPVIHDQRGNYGSRAEARKHCKDEFDYIHAVPFGVEPMGDELWLNPTLCRPHLKRDKAKDAKDSARYKLSIVHFICPELAEELNFYKAALARANTQLAAIVAALNDEDV